MTFIQTYTGAAFYSLDPRPEDVRLADIAHALAYTCRYGGHCRRYFSVAEHAVLVSQAVPAADARWGLLHDAAEAYVGDMVRPLKRQLPGFAEIEARVMAAIAARFGLIGPEPQSVRHADLAICADERAALLGPCDQEWDPLPPSLGVRIRAFGPETAERLFLDRFEELFG